MPDRKKRTPRQVKTKAGLDVARFVSGLKKKFGNYTVDLLSDSELPSLTPHRIGTGALNLDWALSGGIPTSRIIEIYSQSGAEGKSTLAVSILNNAQAHGGLAMLLDPERTTEKKRLKELGVKFTKGFFYGQPETMEKAFEIIESFFRTARKDGHTGEMVVVVDTIAASLTEMQLEAEGYDKQEYAPMARVLSSGLRRINKVIAETGGTLIFINQSREKIGVMWGKKYGTTGGKALGFYTAVRIELYKRETIYGPNKTPLGVEILAKVEKNKAGVPFRTAKLNVMFATGLDPLASAFRFAVQEGVIVKDGTQYRETESGATPFFRSKFSKYLDEHPELEKKIARAFKESMQRSTPVEAIPVENAEEDLATQLKKKRREA